VSDKVNASDIPDDAELWRRIDKRMLDPTTRTLQSWAWDDQRHEVSVFYGRETTAEAVLAAGKPGQIIIRILAGAVRELGYIVARDLEPNNSAHCLILPFPHTRKKRKALCDRSYWHD
jgi:hypothetical protein